MFILLREVLLFVKIVLGLICIGFLKFFGVKKINVFYILIIYINEIYRFKYVF